MSTEEQKTIADNDGPAERNDLQIQSLAKLYRSPNSKIFLTRDSSEIYARLRNESVPVSYHDIYRLKNTVESLSRGREQRILRGDKRYHSFRKFISFSPNHILLSDLLFIPSLRGPSYAPSVVALFMDCFSRLCYAKIQASTASSVTFQSFEESLKFFYANHMGTYKKFCSDRGKY